MRTRRNASQPGSIERPIERREREDELHFRQRKSLQRARVFGGLIVVRVVFVLLLGLCAVGCHSAPPAKYASKTCVPRVVDEAPICGVPPSASDRVKRFALNGPETGGDQMQLAPVCGGLLLEIEWESGAICRQRIASFESIGVLAADAVYVDDRAVCFRVERDALEVRRDDAVIARVPIALGMENAPSFPSRCVD